MTLSELKSVVTEIKRHSVGTVYLKGKRQYIAVRGRGFVAPARYKEQMRRNG